MRPAIIHLIGPPAAGKLTVSRALADHASDAGHRVVVLDNHHTNNVIFSVMEVDGIRPLPPVVWDRIGEVRESMLKAIEELSPPDWSFVFTNVLVDGEPVDHVWVNRLQMLAATTERRFVPVHLSCDADELARRAANDDRRARMKWVDAEAIATFASDVVMLRVASDDAIDLDTTNQSPAESASMIIEHLRRT
jgi:hypothetical protein